MKLWSTYWISFAISVTDVPKKLKCMLSLSLQLLKQGLFLSKIMFSPKGE